MLFESRLVSITLTVEYVLENLSDHLDFKDGLDVQHMGLVGNSA